LPGSSNTELAALKQLVEEQASRHSKELEDLNIQVEKQNEEIKRMLEEKTKLDEKHH
jgi:lipid A disaccharide synthetase